MEYIITKQVDPSQGSFVYSVLDETGRTVGQRISKTGSYVACLVQESNASARVTSKWFRKVEQIGQGSSSTLVWKASMKVARYFGVHNKQHNENKQA